MYSNKNATLFEIIPESDIVTCVENAFDKLNHGHFGDTLFKEMGADTQVICTIFHQLICNEISSLPGWSKGKQKKQADLVHSSGTELQLKTKSESEGIAGNRYSPTSVYTNPSCYYVCVNFIPFDSICKVRAGWVENSWWVSQKGKGNAAVLKREKLQSMPFLHGEYLKKMSLKGIKGIGEKTILKLNNVEINNVSDFLITNKFETAKNILGKGQIRNIESFIEFVKKNDKQVCQ